VVKDLAVLVLMVIALTEFIKRRTGLTGRAVLVISWIIAIVAGVAVQYTQGGSLVRGILPGVLAAALANGSYDFLNRLKG